MAEESVLCSRVRFVVWHKIGTRASKAVRATALDVRNSCRFLKFMPAVIQRSLEHGHEHVDVHNTIGEPAARKTQLVYIATCTIQVFKLPQILRDQLSVNRRSRR